LAALALPAAAQATLERGTVFIRTDGGTVRVAVEIADEPGERRTGLMFRQRLAAGAGMLFVFERDTSGGFWMKNTRIPLSIAFVDRRGVIRRILDMAPCTQDPCRVYRPGVTYRTALEVNRGAFRRLGVRTGDTLRLVRSSAGRAGQAVERRRR
jgi:hypothetical protein